MDDRKDVISEFLFGGTVSCIVEDDETCLVFLKNKSEEVERKRKRNDTIGLYGQ